MEKSKWQYFDGCTRRLKVVGGWIVLYQNTVENEDSTAISATSAMCFVPDQGHLWLNV